MQLKVEVGISELDHNWETCRTQENQESHPTSPKSCSMEGREEGPVFLSERQWIKSLGRMGIAKTVLALHTGKWGEAVKGAAESFQQWLAIAGT